MRRSGGARALAGLGALALLAGPLAARAADPDQPHDRNLLFWTVAQRDYALRRLDRLPGVAVHPIERGERTRAFARGRPLALRMPDGAAPFDVGKFMAEQRGAALLVVVNGKVRIERYGLGSGPADRWTSFSVAKSFTSTLLGAAIADGYVKGLEQPLTEIIPAFRGTAYDGVTVRQLLTMTSGVRWNENYADPQSDVAKLDQVVPVPGEEAIVTYMKGLPREAPPGTKWVYKTGETNLVGAVVMRATGKPLATYLAEKIWRPYGMAADGFWVLDTTGHEFGGCCISATIADFARFGQFMLDGGRVHGKAVLPAGWIAAATRTQAEIGHPGRGYGFQWWSFADGSFAARGLFGQGIFIDPARRIVMAMNADYPGVREEPRWEARVAMFRAVQQAVDREQHRPGRAVIR